MPARAPGRTEAIRSAVFRHQFSSLAEEMGLTLERTGFSPNIKERRDYSCAVFGPHGDLIAQAAHIPVHLGAFPHLMAKVIPAIEWRPGDVVICNDPAWGGTHLPDISALSPVFGASGRLAGFVANRAHHADVGGAFPGSMGPGRQLYEEGIVLPPVHLVRAGERRPDVEAILLANVRTPGERLGDLQAQVGANNVGVRRFQALLARDGARAIARNRESARRQTCHAIRELLATLPNTCSRFEDFLDGDGVTNLPLRIAVAVRVHDGILRVDLTGTSPQVAGCVNAPPAVATSAAAYCLGCLLPEEITLNQGVFDCLELILPPGSLVDPERGAAVAAGNVETSQRLVDAILGALSRLLPDRIPAASQGTMNNLAMGGAHPGTGSAWAFYETLGGGAGGGPAAPGASGGHCHMSNTRNTPVEALEFAFPVRVRRYALREGSGGAGLHPGGMGVAREIEFLAPARVSLLQERQQFTPYGLAGGGPGLPGRVRCVQNDAERPLPGKGTWVAAAGDRLILESPGGGGWGQADRSDSPGRSDSSDRSEDSSDQSDRCAGVPVELH